MREQNPTLFWRSRHGNPVNPFYYAESDGCYKLEKWKVFWYGLDGFMLGSLIDGRDEATACGLTMQKGSAANVTVHVTAKGTTLAYRIDRWD